MAPVSYKHKHIYNPNKIAPREDGVIRVSLLINVSERVSFPPGYNGPSNRALQWFCSPQGPCFTKNPSVISVSGHTYTRNTLNT